MLTNPFTGLTVNVVPSSVKKARAEILAKSTRPGVKHLSRKYRGMKKTGVGKLPKPGEAYLDNPKPGEAYLPRY